MPNQPPMPTQREKRIMSMRNSPLASQRQRARSMQRDEISLTDMNAMGREINHANAEANRQAKYAATPTGQFQQRMQEQQSVPNIFAQPQQPQEQMQQPEMVQTSRQTPVNPNRYADLLRQQAMSHISSILNQYAY